MNTISSLKELGQRLSIPDTRQFAFDVLDECIDPAGVHATRKTNEGKCDNEIWFRAAKVSMAQEGREAATTRVEELQEMLKVSSPFVSDSICAILSRLHRKGGCTTYKSKSSMRQLGITNFPDEASIEASTWRPLGRMLRNNGNANPPLEAVNTTSKPKYETAFAQGIPKLFLVGNTVTESTKVIKKSKVADDDLAWATWLRSEYTEVKKTARGDQLTAGCMLAIHPSVKCYVATESAVVDALREAVEGRSSALFQYDSRLKEWQVSKVDERFVTVEGFTPDTVREISLAILKTAEMQTKVMSVCDKGILCMESPTLSLFSTTLQSEVYQWRKQVRNPHFQLNLINLKQSIKPLTDHLVAASALIQPDETFPSGSILLQKLYRSLCAAESRGNSTAATLYLKLLNISSQPLLYAIMLFMHGGNPGLHLQTDGRLIWEGVRIPEFLLKYEVAISSTGCSVSDVKNIIPHHSVMLATARDSSESQVLTPEYGGVLYRQKGSVSLLHKVIQKSTTTSEPGLTAPLLLGIRLTVKGAVELASSLDAVLKARKSAAHDRQQRLAIREKAAQLKQKQALKELNQRKIIPDEWPGSLHYRKMQRDREEQKKREATKAHYKSLKADVEMENKDPKAMPSSPLGEDTRFSKSEIERVAEIVKMEYAAKMKTLDQRITELGGISKRQHWLNRRRALNTKRIELLMQDVWSDPSSSQTPMMIGRE